MKKSLILTLGLCMGLTLSAADGNLMKNGGFEKISKSTKSSSKYLMQKIKEGWHVGNGPLAILPTNWVLNMGAAKVEMVKKADDAKNVHSGEYAMKVTATKTSHLYTSGAKGGTYDISYWAKGNGTVYIIAYCYCSDKKIRSVTLMNSKVAGDEWKEFKKTVDIKKLCPQVNTFAFAVAFAKNSVVVIDDISLAPAAAPATQASK